MNQRLIDNWNAVVGKNDLVYHLGDFGFGTVEELRRIRKSLNGTIEIVRGNHDQSIQRMIAIGFNGVHNKLILKYQCYNILLRHKPLDVLEAKKTDFLMLVMNGHSHSKPENKLKLVNNFPHLDIGVDAWNYTPVNIDIALAELVNFEPDIINIKNND